MTVLDRIRLKGAEHEKRAPKGLFFLLRRNPQIHTSSCASGAFRVLHFFHISHLQIMENSTSKLDRIAQWGMGLLVGLIPIFFVPITWGTTVQADRKRVG